MAKKEERLLAYTLYMNTELSQREIAQRVKVSEKTLSKWAADEEWELKKAASEVTREEQIRNFLMQLKELNDEIKGRTDKRYPSAAESDTIKKITSSIKDLQKGANLTDYIQVSEELLKFLLLTTPELAKQLADPIHEFVSVKAKELAK